jgi:hypothetical protein
VREDAEVDGSESPAATTDVLRATVTEVLGAVAKIVIDRDPKATHICRANVTSTGVDGRVAWIRAATTGWVDLTLRSHCVSTTLLDDDPNAAELEDEIRALALVAHEYLTGGGRVVQQRAWIRKRHVVVIETIHGEWILGHRSSKNPDL